MAPDLPPNDECSIAPNAILIGQVRLKRDASVWFGGVLRADDEIIELGARSNMLDGCVLHVDPGYPLTIGEDCTIGHQVMLHDCVIGSNTLITENKVIPDNSLVMGAPGRVVREIDAVGARNLTEGAALYVRRWRRYTRELAPAPGGLS